MAIAQGNPSHNIEPWMLSEEIDALRKEMDDMFEQFVSSLTEKGGGFAATPLADIAKTENVENLKSEVHDKKSVN